MLTIVNKAIYFKQYPNFRWDGCMVESNQTTGDGEAQQKIKVLVVDDHQLVRQVLSQRLDNEDDIIVIDGATNGIEAIRLANETSPDVILMDINMPEMDGIEATKKILANNNHVRIIGLSLHNYKVARIEMLKAGAVAYHNKSDNFYDLCKTIRNEAI